MKFLFFPAGGPVLHQDRQRVDYFLHQIVWQQFGGNPEALGRRFSDRGDHGIGNEIAEAVKRQKRDQTQRNVYEPLNPLQTIAEARFCSPQNGADGTRRSVTMFPRMRSQAETNARVKPLRTGM